MFGYDTQLSFAMRSGGRRACLLLSCLLCLWFALSGAVQVSDSAKERDQHSRSTREEGRRAALGKYMLSHCA